MSPCICQKCGCSNPCDCGERYCTPCLLVEMELEKEKEKERFADTKRGD